MTDQPLAAPEPLTMPEPLVLTAPSASEPVAETAAPRMAPQIDPNAVPALDAKVDTFLQGLTETETRSPEFAQQAADVRTMGDKDIRAAAETSNRLLKSPVRALQEGGVSKESKVGQTLMELRRTVEDLDPKQATGAKKWIERLPFTDRLTGYFKKYESAEKHLDAILHALRNGQDELSKDNAALNMYGFYRDLMGGASWEELKAMRGGEPEIRNADYSAVMAEGADAHNTEAEFGIDEANAALDAADAAARVPAATRAEATPTGAAGKADATARGVDGSSIPDPEHEGPTAATMRDIVRAEATAASRQRTMAGTAARPTSTDPEEQK